MQMDSSGLANRPHRFGLAFNGASMTMAFADIDNDGDLDGYLATTAMPPPPGVKFQVRFEGNKPVVLDELREYWELHLPARQSAFTAPRPASSTICTATTAAALPTSPARPASTARTSRLSATWWDYNDDGRPDLYVANDFFGPDRLYRNNGDGRFTDVAAESAAPHAVVLDGDRRGRRQQRRPRRSPGDRHVRPHVTPGAW